MIVSSAFTDTSMAEIPLTAISTIDRRDRAAAIPVVPPPIAAINVVMAATAASGNVAGALAHRGRTPHDPPMHPLAGIVDDDGTLVVYSTGAIPNAFRH